MGHHLRNHAKESCKNEIHTFFTNSPIPPYAPAERRLNGYVELISQPFDWAKYNKRWKPQVGSDSEEGESDDASIGSTAGEPDARTQKRWVKEGRFAGSTASVDNSSKPFKMPLPKDHIMDRRSDFLMPFNVYCPSPPLKIKNWKDAKRNHWVGREFPRDKSRRRHFSQCVCIGNCGDDCLNKMLQYECDSHICPMGDEDCGNRAIQQMNKISHAPHNLYAQGYQVFKTKNRGYGLRAIREYLPGELICEYTGDVIDQEEMQNRLHTVYKGTQNYYFLSLEKGFVIDSGRRGSAARFVNHSCSPNSEMQKWYVNESPRIALFAGSKSIMPGDELTYDYNFAWFDGAEPQTCKCGSPSCRGIIGKRGQNSSASSSVQPSSAGNTPVNHEDDLEVTNPPKKVTLTISKALLSAGNARSTNGKKGKAKKSRKAKLSERSERTTKAVVNSKGGRLMKQKRTMTIVRRGDPVNTMLSEGLARRGPGNGPKMPQYGRAIGKRRPREFKKAVVLSRPSHAEDTSILDKPTIKKRRQRSSSVKAQSTGAKRRSARNSSPVVYYEGSESEDPSESEGMHYKAVGEQADKDKAKKPVIDIITFSVSNSNEDETSSSRLDALKSIPPRCTQDAIEELNAKFRSNDENPDRMSSGMADSELNPATSPKDIPLPVVSDNTHNSQPLNADTVADSRDSAKSWRSIVGIDSPSTSPSAVPSQPPTYPTAGSHLSLFKDGETPVSVTRYVGQVPQNIPLSLIGEGEVPVSVTKYTGPVEQKHLSIDRSNPSSQLSPTFIGNGEVPLKITRYTGFSGNNGKIENPATPESPLPPVAVAMKTSETLQSPNGFVHEHPGDKKSDTVLQLPGMVARLPPKTRRKNYQPSKIDYAADGRPIFRRTVHYRPRFNNNTQFHYSPGMTEKFEAPARSHSKAKKSGSPSVEDDPANPKSRRSSVSYASIAVRRFVPEKPGAGVFQLSQTPDDGSSLVAIHHPSPNDKHVDSPSKASTYPTMFRAQPFQGSNQPENGAVSVASSASSAGPRFVDSTPLLSKDGSALSNIGIIPRSQLEKEKNVA